MFGLGASGIIKDCILRTGSILKDCIFNTGSSLLISNSLIFIDFSRGGASEHECKVLFGLAVACSITKSYQ